MTLVHARGHRGVSGFIRVRRVTGCSALDSDRDLLRPKVSTAGSDDTRPRGPTPPNDDTHARKRTQTHADTRAHTRTMDTAVARYDAAIRHASATDGDARGMDRRGSGDLSPCRPSSSSSSVSILLSFYCRRHVSARPPARPSVRPSTRRVWRRGAHRYASPVRRRRHWCRGTSTRARDPTKT